MRRDTGKARVRAKTPEGSLRSQQLCAGTRAKPVSARRPLKGRFAPNTKGTTVAPAMRRDTGKARVRKELVRAAGGDRTAELLLPPVRRALVHLRLQLADVLGEVGLALAQPELEVGDDLLALLELDLAELGVGLGP